MEAILGISLYSYSYLKLAKTLCLSYYCLCFLFSKIREEGRMVLLEAGDRGGEGSTMYTLVSKCKNDKMKGENNNNEKGNTDQNYSGVVASLSN
jgi:hypothetical protein